MLANERVVRHGWWLNRHKHFRSSPCYYYIQCVTGTMRWTSDLLNQICAVEDIIELHCVLCRDVVEMNIHITNDDGWSCINGYALYNVGKVESRSWSIDHNEQ